MKIVTRSKSFVSLSLLAAALTLGVACRKAEAPAPAPPPTVAPAPAPVASVALGTAVGADNRISAAASTFKPTDTVYLSVTTQGEQGGRSLAARWTYGDGAQLVHESLQALPPGVNVVTEFHIGKPDGFPAGAYKVDVTLDGQSVASQSFVVQ